MTVLFCLGCELFAEVRVLEFDVTLSLAFLYFFVVRVFRAVRVTEVPWWQLFAIFAVYVPFCHLNLAALSSLLQGSFFSLDLFLTTFRLSGPVDAEFTTLET